MKTAIDLFAGAGGLSEGLRQAGYRVVFASELSEAHSLTHQANHSETEVSTGDIRDVDAAQVRKRLGLKKGELDLVAGGPPCQGFSVNAPIRSTDDTRNHLFLQFLRFVSEFNPKAVLIENVPGMVSYEKGQTVTAILDSLQQLGYKAAVKILYAPHYGVPQMRWRTVFLANRVGVDPLKMFPHPTHYAVGRANFTTRYLGQSLVVSPLSFTDLPPQVTVADAIIDLPPIDNGGGLDEMDYSTPANSQYQSGLRSGAKKVFNHQCAGLGNVNLQRLPHIPQGGSWRDIPFDILPAGMKRARRSDHTKRYGRLALDGIASTILTKCDPHWGTYIHPTQDRIISIREAARFQSFPDSFRFFGSMSDKYEQVGNAVPPHLARCVAVAISDAVDGLTKRESIYGHPQYQFQL